MRLTRSSCLGIFLVLVACDSSTEPKGAREIGTIDFGGTLPHVIEAPANASPGETFTVTVSTFGNSCVSPSGADVVVDGLVATIIPYDVLTTGVCLDYLKPYPRPVQVSFARAGTATIRVTGRSFSQSGLVSVDRTVAVS